MRRGPAVEEDGQGRGEPETLDQGIEALLEVGKFEPPEESRAVGDPSVELAYSLGDDTFVNLDGAWSPLPAEWLGPRRDTCRTLRAVRRGDRPVTPRCVTI